VQVHILYDPSKEELGRKLEKLRPDILTFHGERDCERDEIGSLVLRDGKEISSECLGPYLSAKIPELVCVTIAHFILPYLVGMHGSFAPIFTSFPRSLFPREENADS
jgi:hypothetical protein